MTIKARIALYITGAGFIASLLFSVVVFLELIEQPFRLLDTVLKEEAYKATRMALGRQRKALSPPSDSNAHPMDTYWVEVYEPGTGKILYRSGLARLVTLSPVKPGSGAIDSAIIPRKQSNQNHDKNREVTFRVRTFLVKLDDGEFVVQIARPMEKLKEEIWDLVFGIFSGLIFSTLALIAISRLMAGKILKPVG
ncbi:MAG: sensor histidine kinase, partial [Deltaproteobacteria bacterium]|nr:sensor histidine kinase [Deltaproteobacteria bacterium]